MSLLLAVFCGAVACDNPQADAAASNACQANTEIYVLPTVEEAAKLRDSISSRQMGTMNLLLAKYASKSAPVGTRCEVHKEQGDFARVTTQPGGLTGWVPLAEVRERGEQ